jgi:hypothetical protein
MKNRSWKEHSRFGDETPPWWPEGEPWPPSHRDHGEVWRHVRSGIFLRGGLMLVLVFFFGCGGISLTTAVIISALGWVKIGRAHV